MRTRTRGIQLAPDGTRVVNKEYKRRRIFQRLGTISQSDAEAWLQARQAEIDADEANSLRSGGRRLFADAARKYLSECEVRNVRTLELISHHVLLLLPHIGSQTIDQVCNDSLENFKLARISEGVKNSTINRSLEVARTILHRAARVWRDGGRPWLSSAPLIEMLDETVDKRLPRPISWAEQANLFPRLPPHLADMCEFTVNTGARDENVCGLMWRWEVPVPELDRSVFVIPAECFKTKRPHVLILNDVAWRIVQRQRGRHEDYVFVYRRERVKNFDKPPEMKYHRVGTMNTNAFQQARAEAGLRLVRVHDLRHTYGQRLRDAGVSEEDRALLLGHVVQGMPQHYATATIARLVEAANKVQETRDRTTLLPVVNG